MKTQVTLLTASLVAALAACETPTEPPEAGSPETVLADNHTAGGANGGTSVLRADLVELNGSGAAGQMTLRLSDDRIQVTLTARGLSPELPHAQHIHIGGANMCPRPEQDFDRDGNGFIDTLEGAPAYGGVRVSLTTEGDASAASGLAVDRFPLANSDGVVTYRRDIPMPEGLSAAELFGGSVVVHGISELFGDAGAYDGEPRSSLLESIPLEVTIPALCGELSAPGSR